MSSQDFKQSEIRNKFAEVVHRLRQYALARRVLNRMTE
ncbi:hypothetical protein LPU83_pLPU83c_0401 (plasmid) [Rhizobium favelukesii]|uniref:Uncharacterized protein n=1 Tax=Rhizobium favelukesii TaxID=348824 RepID=W6RQ35_9HYPH|nr:hypothetical protein LPU83_pLPU83c_0401 [Rhizobium favelukesii]